jgi:Lon-like protease
MHRRTAALVTSGALLLGMAGIAAVLPVPYVTLSPGPVFNTLGEVAGKPVITVEGAATYPTDGVLDATTVYEAGGPGNRMAFFQAFRGWLDPAVSVVPRELLHPSDESQQDAEEQGAQQMVFSQQDAVAAALKYLDEPGREVVQVQSVLNGSPADGVLRPADLILRVDGTPVTGPEQVRRLISSRPPGDPVRLRIQRGDERTTETVVTEPDPRDPDRAVVGVIPGSGFISPITVQLQLGNVAGPSAGLMFTLGIIDTMTPGPLNGGEHIAGTGTITAGGRVGPIGGIQQKLFGARDNGAQYFLAPASNCDDVVGHVPDGLQVVRVATLDQAVDAVEAIAHGDTGDLPTCTSQAS